MMIWCWWWWWSWWWWWWWCRVRCWQRCWQWGVVQRPTFNSGPPPGPTTKLNRDASVMDFFFFCSFLWHWFSTRDANLLRKKKVFLRMKKKYYGLKHSIFHFDRRVHSDPWKKSILRHFAQNHKYLQLEKSTKYCKKGTVGISALGSGDKSVCCTKAASKSKSPSMEASVSRGNEDLFRHSAIFEHSSLPWNALIVEHRWCLWRLANCQVHDLEMFWRN